MARKNINERGSSVVLQERMETLFKKAEELSILCGVEIGIVVFSPHKKMLNMSGHQETNLNNS